MAASIDRSLLDDDGQLMQRSYRILDEMKTRGNQVAGFMSAELQQLEMILAQAMPVYRKISMTDSCHSANKAMVMGDNTGTLCEITPPFMGCAIGDANWEYTMTTEQMIQVADSLDFEGIDWAGF